MGVRSKLHETRWRTAGHFRRPLANAFLDPLRGARALEVGGPSAVFGATGLLPVYRVCAAVDCVQFSAETIWHGRQAGTYAPDGVPTGSVHISDAGSLDELQSATYDAVLSSHVIEHLANPLRALAVWRRVCRPGGVALVVAPHKEGTFDHRRPVTPLAHIIADLEAGTREDDLTHLDETLRLHDRRRDAEAADDQAWTALRRDNVRHRVLHHHVFTTRSLVEMLAYACVRIVAVTVRYPHDIYVLGHFAEEPQPLPDVQGVLRHSPFTADRRDSRL